MIGQLLFFMALHSSPLISDEILDASKDVTIAKSDIVNSDVSDHSKAASLSAQRKGILVERLANEIEKKYVFAEVGRSVAQHLRARLKKGSYDSVSHPLQFATLLTKDAQEIARDKHLTVFYSAVSQKNSDKTEGPLPKLSDEEIAKNRNETMLYYKRLNYGVRRIEHFDGNIAYLDLFMFGDLGFVGKGITAAMVLLEGSDAMIIDLRDNTGGSPETVQYIVSHFVSKPTHIMDNYRRDDDSTRQSWTSSYLNVPVYDSRKMVYILTSHKTFSAAEDLAYTMQSLKRAKIVGEITGGGAHAGFRFPLDENFTAFISNQRSISPITKSNWEGVGVIPDVQVDADKALLMVRLEILQNQLQKVSNPRERSEIVESILALKVAMKKL